MCTRDIPRVGCGFSYYHRSSGYFTFSLMSTPVGRKTRPRKTAVLPCPDI